MFLLQEKNVSHASLNLDVLYRRETSKRIVSGVIDASHVSVGLCIRDIKPLGGAWLVPGGW